MAKRTKTQKSEQIAAVLHNMREISNSARSAAKLAGVPISTFCEWVDSDPSLAEQYARARADMIDRIAEDILIIADEPVGGGDNGMTDGGAVQKQRLQVDARKWLLSKLAPKKYGERLALAGDDESPIKLEISERLERARARAHKK